MEPVHRRAAALAGLGLAGLLAGCVVAGAPGDAGYQTGYLAGCQNGQVYAGAPVPGAIRDEGRYGTDSAYAAGWDRGVEACYQEAMRRPQVWGANGR